MSRSAVPPLLVSVTVLLGGCGDAGHRAERADVEGRQYIAADETGADLTLAFRDDSLSVSGGCNGTGGPYTLKGGRISQPDAIQSLMDCSAPDRDDWLNDLVDEGQLTAFDDGDRLELIRKGAKVVFQRQGPTDGPTPVEGPTWTAQGFVGPMKRPTLRIADGRAKIFTGCGWRTASAKYDDGYVEFGPMSDGERVCAGYVGRAEGMVLKALSGRARVTFYRRTQIEFEHNGASLTFSLSR